MRELVIIGAGGHGRETLDIVEAINAASPRWLVRGFVDDGPVVSSRGERQRAEHVGPVQAMQHVDAQYVIGIGEPAVRASLDAKMTSWGRSASTLIHPLASLGAENQIADGVVLAAGARVTTNVVLGRHVHLNVNAVVSHDCVVGAYTTLSPGVHLNGAVTIGERSFIGTGAIVIPGISIGSDTMIGAGTVVVGDVPDGVTAKGVPGRW